MAYAMDIDASAKSPANSGGTFSQYTGPSTVTFNPPPSMFGGVNSLLGGNDASGLLMPAVVIFSLILYFKNRGK